MDTRNLQYMLDVVSQKDRVTGGDAVYLLQEVLKVFSGNAGGVDKLTCAPQDAAALSALLNGLTRLAAANSDAFSASGQRQRLENFSQKAQDAGRSLEEVARLTQEAAEAEKNLSSLLSRLEPERGALLRRQEENQRKRRRIAELQDGRLDQAVLEAAEIDRRCEELEQIAARQAAALAKGKTRLAQLQQEIQRLADEEAALSQQETTLADTLAKQKTATEQTQARTEKIRRQLEDFQASRTEMERRQQEAAAQAEAFSQAWKNLWQRNEADRALYLQQLADRIPGEAGDNKTSFPAVVQTDLSRISHWLGWVREQLQLGVQYSEEMLERKTEAQKEE